MSQFASLLSARAWVVLWIALAVCTSLGCQAWPVGSAAKRLDNEIEQTADEPSSADEPSPDAAESSRERKVAAALGSLRSADPEARFSGIDALGALGGAEAQAALREVAGGKGELFRAAAVSALARLEDYAAVRNAARDESFRVRRAAAEGLARDSSPEAANTLESLLSDRSTEVQVRAAESLAERPLAVAGPPLLLALESSHYATRAAAQRLLAQRWPPAARISENELSELALPRSRIEALQAAWREEFGAESLRAQPPAPRENIAAAGSEPIPLDQLLERLSSAVKHERLAAAAELVRLGNERGYAALEGLALDLDPEVRRATAESLGTLEDPLFLAPLIRLLDDQPAVRLAALKGLRRIVGRDVAAEQSPPAVGAAEEAERWKSWYSRGGDAAPLAP